MGRIEGAEMKTSHALLGLGLLALGTVAILPAIRKKDSVVITDATAGIAVTVPTSVTAITEQFTPDVRAVLGEQLGASAPIPAGQELEALARVYNATGENDVAVLLRDLPSQLSSVKRYLEHFAEQGRLAQALNDPWVKQTLSLAGIRVSI